MIRRNNIKINANRYLFYEYFLLNNNLYALYLCDGVSFISRVAFSGVRGIFFSMGRGMDNDVKYRKNYVHIIAQAEYLHL